MVNAPSEFYKNSLRNKQETNQHRLRTAADILESIDDYVSAFDKDWNFIYVNKATANDFGFKPEELIGKNFWKSFPKFIGTDLEKNYREAMSKREIRRFEWKTIYATGGFLEFKVFPSAEGITVYGVNITVRKMAEEMLKKNEEQLEAIIQNAPIGIATTDSNKYILSANESFCKILGFSENELRKLTFMDFTHPDDIKESINLLKKLSLGQIPVFSQEKHYIRKDGTIIHGRITVSAVRNKSKPVLFIAELEDITERKKNEEEIARLASFPTLNPNSIVEIDYEGNLTYANPASKKIFPDLETAKLHHPLLLEWNNVVETLKADNKKTIGREVEVNGHWYHEQFYLVPERSRVRLYNMNIDERKRLQFQLEKYANDLERLVEERTNQLKAKERLAAIGATAGMVGHDIRNPLQAMISDVYLLKDYLAANPDMQYKPDIVESLEGIEKNIVYINKIVADLQDYAKEAKLDYMDVDLYELVTSVFVPMTIPDNLSMSIDIDSSFRIYSDPTVLSRILTNLIINAIQAMPNGGKLIIGASKKENKVLIMVEDTGVGIPDDFKPKLFTPMMTTKSQGQGFGLAVVKRLVEALNGTITYESQVGKGTKFSLELPSQS